MILFQDTAVRPFGEVAILSLLYGRLKKNDVNRVVVRTELQKGHEMVPHLAVLTPSETDQSHPFLCVPRFPSTLLDLGTEWNIDVALDANAPNFDDAPENILVRSGAVFFVYLPSDGLFLNIANGTLVSNLPDQENIAYWSAFAIRLPQQETEGLGTEIFRFDFKY